MSIDDPLHVTEGWRRLRLVEAERDRLKAKNERLRSVLQVISEWDCLNPPAVDMLHDLSWLQDLVTAALTGDDDD